MKTGKSLLQQRVATLSPAQQRELQRRVRERRTRAPELQRRPAGERVPLSYGQQRFWVLDQLTPENPAYNETNSMRFRFPLDMEVFRRAVNEIVRRHEVLRTSVEEIDGEACQTFAPSLTVAIPVVDLRYLPPGERETEAARLAAEQSRMMFALRAGPLLRASVFRLDAADYMFVLTLHHMICDGWSMGVFMVELITLYWSFVGGQPSPLPELSLQYGDFALWQHRTVAHGGHRSQLAYWRARLADLPTLQFPTDWPRPPDFTFRGARERLEISGAALAALTDLARRRNTTLFTALLTIFAILLHRYTQEEDIVIGAPSAGRSRGELEPLIGCFINTLVLRVKLSDAQTFLEVLETVQQTTAEAHANQDVPFERLVEELQPRRDPSRNPLVQILFQLFKAPSPAGLQQDAFLPFTPVDSGISKVDLSVEFIWTDGRIAGHVEYNTDLFERGRIVRLIGHYHRLIESVTTDPTQCVAELALLTSAEEKQLLVEWNNTSVPYPRDRTIPEVFRDVVRQFPNVVALRFSGRTMTYRELSEHAATLASVLKARGIRPGHSVGLYLERGLELPAVLLGILDAGCAYIPLAPSYPRERVAYLLADSGVHAVVTTKARVGELTGFTGPIIALDDLAEVSPPQTEDNVSRDSSPSPPPSNATDVAYVMYTSGTTGQPKGVAVTHRNILRLVKNVRYVNLAPGQTVLHFAPVSFDAATFEIWGALLNGGVIAIHPPGVPSLEELGAFIKREKINLLFLTTNLFAQMIEYCAADLREVGQILTGGEQFFLPVAEAAWKALPRSTIANIYGPTESTTFATFYPIGSPETLREPVPIGRPIENTTAYVLDRAGKLLPVGVPGELYLGGDGVAAGYWKRPELTRERFVPDPFVPNGRLYKTGDIACFRDDGNILFLGRRDRQVKLSGFRVELGEVEAALLAHPAVGGAVALVSGTAEKRLTAFCETRPGRELSAAELRRFLSQRVPQYMVPTKIELVEQLPLTPNGKIDTQALARLERGVPEATEGFVAPRTPTERALCDLWSSVLDLQQVGVTDNFFALGGHSLLAMRILSRLRQEFGVPIAMREFFDQPTIEGLSRIIGQKRAPRGEALASVSQAGA